MSEIFETMSEVIPHEDRFPCYVTLPTLQEMASYRVALSIFYGFVSRTKNYNMEMMKTSQRDWLEMMVFRKSIAVKLSELVIHLNVAPSIKEMISSCLRKVSLKAELHLKRFNGKFCNEFRIDCFDVNCLVWLNGKIDFDGTALKMLSTLRLSEIQTFAILSELCMENEIENLSTNLIRTVNLEDIDFTSNRNRLICYWVHYVKGKLHEIPLDDFSSIDSMMAAKCSDDNRMAFRYFWDRLNHNDQISVVKHRFISDLSQYLLKLFALLSLTQQRQLLSEIPGKIIINFLTRWNNRRSALWAWNHCKDLITLDQFTDIVKQLAVIIQGTREDKDIASFLITVWDSAKDDQRKFVLCKAENIVTDVLSPCPSSTALEFIYKILLLKNVSYRKRVMLENATKFGVGHHLVDYPIFIKLFNLCLPNAEHRLQFKKEVATSKAMEYYCGELFKARRFVELKLHIEFYYLPDVNAAQEFLNTLFNSGPIERSEFVANLTLWNKLSEFIDGIFPKHPSLSSDVKRQFVSYCASLWPEKYSETFSTFGDLREIVESVFVNEELESIKQKILKGLRNLMIVDTDFCWLKHYNEQDFLMIIKWCVGDSDEAIRQFKNDTPVDSTFNTVVGWMIIKPKTASSRSYRPFFGSEELLLTNLNKYLTWYFASATEAKMYKSSMMFNEKMFEFMKISKNDYVSTILNLVFEGDQVLIRKFKSEK